MECYKSHYCYKNIVKDIDDYGFEKNGYDPHVSNKTVNGFQITVRWHMDDLKVYHKDGFYITRFETYLQEIYEGIQASRGKVHNYLGMKLDDSGKGKLQVSMIPYMINMLKEFPEELGIPAATPATEHLFKVRLEVE